MNWSKIRERILQAFKKKKAIDEVIELKESIEDGVTRLRELGKTQIEIAKELNVSINQVKYVIQKLLKSGKIERKRK